MSPDPDSNLRARIAELEKAGALSIVLLQETKSRFERLLKERDEARAAGIYRWTC